jgi:hypothetical protein
MADKRSFIIHKDGPIWWLLFVDDAGSRVAYEWKLDGTEAIPEGLGVVAYDWIVNETVPSEAKPHGS